MKYSILVYETRDEVQERNDESKQAAYWGAYQAYTQALQEAGVMVGGSALEPSHAATTIRLRGGERQVQDGPYADTKEQLGGYYEIDVPDLDAAMDWAAKCPASAAGSVEVRPMLVMNS